MAKKHTLTAETRARTGSGLLKQMRREGWLPSVMYGKGIEPKNLKIGAKAFEELLGESESENILVNLKIADGGTGLAFLQAVQHDPLTGEVLHADFLAVNEKTEVNASVPVHLLGEPVGVKAGGVLEQSFYTLDVTCKATHLPELFEFDVSHLDEGDSLHIGEITLPEGVTSDYTDDVVLAHVGRPAALVAEEAEGAAEGEAAAPEAAQEGEKEEEPAEA